MSVCFEIPALPPSLNRLLRNRALRIREPAKWDLLVRQAARGIAPFTVPVIITLTFYGAVDADNHAKLVLDGIVRAGLIPDDRWPHLFELRLRARPKLVRISACTMVEIEPCYT